MKKVLIYGKRGCWGDFQIAIFSVVAYKKKYPTHEIYFSWKEEQFIPLLFHNPDITKIIPWDDNIITNNTVYDKIYNVGDEICCSYEAENFPPDKSRNEILCRQLDGCYPYLSPKVHLSPEERNRALKHRKTIGNKFKIGVISRTHSSVRNYDKFDEIYDLLPKDVHIMVFKKYNLDWSDTQWGNNTEIFVDKPIREVLSLLSICDVVIGCDTGPMHSAAGLGVPTIWLFGVTDGKLATREYRNAVVIQKKNNCRWIPCWYQLQCERNIMDLQCVCMKDIEPQEIVNEIMPLYERWKNHEKV